MKPHPKLRTAVKWGGFLMCVVLVAVWVASGWWYIAWGSRKYGNVEVLWGCVSLSQLHPYSSVPAPMGWEFQRLNRAFDWSHMWYHDPVGWNLTIPLWMPALPLFIATATAWRLDIRAKRRARVGACAKCGYDLRGLPANTPCPECGRAAATRTGEAR